MEKLVVVLLVCAFSSMVICRPAHQKQKRWVYEVNKDPIIVNHQSTCATALQDYVNGKITMYEYKTLINHCIHKAASDEADKKSTDPFNTYNSFENAGNAIASPALASFAKTQEDADNVDGDSDIDDNQDNSDVNDDDDDSGDDEGTNEEADDMRRRMQVQRQPQPQYYNYNGYYANSAPAYPGYGNGHFTQQTFPLRHSQSTVELNAAPYMNGPMLAQRSRVPIQNYNAQAQMMRQWNMQQLGTIRNQVPGQFVARQYQQQQSPMYANSQ